MGRAPHPTSAQRQPPGSSPGALYLSAAQGSCLSHEASRVSSRLPVRSASEMENWSRALSHRSGTITSPLSRLMSH